jgi:hypothetical protein
LNFARLRARSWDPITNERSVDAQVRAEVFVFTVQCQRDPSASNGCGGTQQDL